MEGIRRSNAVAQIESDPNAFVPGAAPPPEMFELLKKDRVDD